MYNRILAAAIVITGYLISNPQTLLAQEPELTVRVLACIPAQAIPPRSKASTISVI
jgi:hypothetical protein